LRRIFKIFFARELTHHARARCDFEIAREHDEIRANFSRVAKKRVFPMNFHFFQKRFFCAALRARVRSAAVARSARRVTLRATAVFPLKTRKFACRIRGNAYHDRMKRVNPRRATMNAGD